MSYLYADLPVKLDNNGNLVHDTGMAHSEPVLFPGDKLRWRLVSQSIPPADLAQYRLKIKDVAFKHNEKGKGCSEAYDYPLHTPKGQQNWSDSRVKETKIRAAKTKRVFPRKLNGSGTCKCEFHEYKATAYVRKKGQPSSQAVEIDPHVRFHRGG